jgi:excisionase family DNA binding protein
MDANYSFKLLKAAEVAEILRISRSKVYRFMKTGDLPSVRMDRTVRVRKKDLEEFIESHIYNG